MNQYKHDILVVDDESVNRQVIMDILSFLGYKLRSATNGREALEEIQSSPPDLIVMDVMIPEMNGYEVCKQVKNDPVFGFIPIILITELDQFEDRIRGVEAGADEFITKPVHPLELKARVKNLFRIKEMHNELVFYQKQLKEQNQVLEEMVKERTMALEQALKDLKFSHQKLIDAQKDTLLRLSLVAEYKDLSTANHIQRIGYYTMAIANALGWSEEMQNILQSASQMHDVGKIGIPDDILTKKNKLTAKEFSKMREHTIIGAKLLSGSNSSILIMAQEIAQSHHERWDGKGYPSGLKGEEIPISGRITAVADVFDALISDRCYKKAWSIKKAFNSIKKNAGTVFDSKIVNAFFSVQDEILQIVERFKEF